MGLSLHADHFRHLGANSPLFQNLVIEPQEGMAIGVGGDNGSGKSTLLLCICGVYPYLRKGEFVGTISLGDLELNRESFEMWRRSIAYVPQDSDSGILGSTVREELTFDLVASGIKYVDAWERVEPYVDAFALGDILDRSPSSLSHGEKHRVVLSAALAKGADLILFDEPTAMLDKSGSDTFSTLVSNLLASEASSLVISSHDQDMFKKFPVSITILGKNIVPSNEWCIPTVDELVSTIGSHPSCAMHSDPPTLSVIEVTATVDGGRVVGPISFEAAPGDIVWVRGPNGSGKSTLLRSIAGIEPPMAGKVILTKRGSGSRAMAVQDPRFQIVGLTIEDDLSLLNDGSPSGLQRRSIADAIWASLGTTSVELGRDPRSLSFGEKRLLSVISVGVDADLIIMDEPTAGLDAKHRMWLANYIGALSKVGKIVILASHDSTFSSSLASCSVDVKGAHLPDGE